MDSIPWKGAGPRKPDILIYFLAFLPCVTLPPAAAVGPMGLILAMRIA